MAWMSIRQRWPYARLPFARRGQPGNPLPFGEGTFELVYAKVALPYMDIPVALEEWHRVLVRVSVPGADCDTASADRWAFISKWVTISPTFGRLSTSCTSASCWIDIRASSWAGQ